MAADKSNKFDDINKEFQELKTSLEKAREQFQNNEFEQAQTSFFTALKLAESLGTKTEKVESLNGMGACYYESKKYIEARAVYQQLVNELPDGIDEEVKIEIKLRFARSTDRLEDFDKAHELFQETYELAEDCLEPGEPLLTEVYEAYASILRRARRDPEKLALLEKKVRFNRQKQAGFVEPAFDLTSSDTEEKEEEFDDLDTTKLSGKLISFTRRKPGIAFLLITSPLTLTLLSLVSVVTLAFFDVDFGTGFPIKENTYSSIDGRVKLQLDKTESFLIVGDSKRPVRTRSLTKWTELISLMKWKSISQYWLTPTKYGFRGEDNRFYVDASSPVFNRDKVMIALSEKIIEFKKVKDRFPVSNKEFEEQGYEFPKEAGFQFEIRDIRVDSESDINASEELKNLRQRQGILWDSLRLSKSFTAQEPYVVRAFVPKQSSEYFFMLTTDAKSAPVVASPDSEPDILFWSSGTSPQIVQGLKDKNSYSSIETVAISNSSRQAVQEKCIHVLIAVGLFFVLILPGGFYAFKPLRGKHSLFKYSPGRHSGFNEGMVLSCYLLALMAYCCYLIWALF